MAIRKIEKQEWKNYFNTFSKNFLVDEQPEYAEIKIISESLGDQPETSWLLLQDIAYDPRNDVLDIIVEKLDHRIQHPTEIYVDEEDDGWVTSIQIAQGDGTKDIIELR